MIIITMDMDCCKSSIPYLSMLMVKYMRIVCFMGLKKLFFLASVTTVHVQLYFQSCVQTNIATNYRCFFYFVLKEMYSHTNWKSFCCEGNK